MGVCRQEEEEEFLGVTTVEGGLTPTRGREHARGKRLGMFY